MKSNELKKLISQIKKYDLTKAFKTAEEFDQWLANLNAKQIWNFNNLTVEPSSIKFPMNLLINEDLLNCDDYNKRINLMLQLKNEDDCWHLFDRLCYPNFLNSENYYRDIEMISKANTARYALLAINNDAFIQSKYHNEDLKRIIEAKDTRDDSENKLDWLVAASLATVARSKNSIKSPYHRKDMELIATSGSKCLQMNGSYPENSLNNLAINDVSLSDKYHLENMQILSKSPIASEYLYNIMTDPDIIKGKNYREEVEALVNAKSKTTALAIYYIINPQNIHRNDFTERLYCGGLDATDISLINMHKVINVSSNQKYLEYLKLLNQIDDKYVMLFASLIADRDLSNSSYQEYDLNLLLSVTDKDIFRDLYKLMINEHSLTGPHHIKDANLIAKTTDEMKRKLLLSKATKECSINSDNHEYDMQYITKLDLNNMDEECYRKVCHYLFSSDGIEHTEHIDRLEKLYRGEKIEENDTVLEHLNNLEHNLDTNAESPVAKSRVLSKIKKYLKINKN